MAATFDVLRQVGGTRRRILALGEMRELGPDAQTFHRDVGAEAAALRPALLLVVGPNAGWYVEGAVQAGFPAAATVRVETPQEAVQILRAAIRPGDVVLVKGSRVIEMEHVVVGLKGTVSSHT
jgi:UDP-N-acetylmuramoyl-tripeptide--D-alanyl-D-alanine ligase